MSSSAATVGGALLHSEVPVLTVSLYRLKLRFVERDRDVRDFEQQQLRAALQGGAKDGSLGVLLMSCSLCWAVVSLPMFVLGLVLLPRSQDGLTLRTGAASMVCFGGFVFAAVYWWLGRTEGSSLPAAAGLKWLFDCIAVVCAAIVSLIAAAAL